MNCPRCESEIVDWQATICPECLAPVSASMPVAPVPPTDPIAGYSSSGPPALPSATQSAAPTATPFGAAPPEPSVAKKVGLGSLALALRFMIPILILGFAFLPRLYRSVSGAGDYTDISDVAVGSCFNLFTDTSEEFTVEAADVIDCNVEHDFEMIGAQGFIGVTTYADSIVDDAFDDCFTVAESYLDFDRIPDDLSLDVLVPTEESWDDGDRQYLCYVYRDTGATMAQSWRR